MVNIIAEETLWRKRDARVLVCGILEKFVGNGLCIYLAKGGGFFGRTSCLNNRKKDL